eukprot:scaffold252670_cov21-Tisochrysis_lutea.AAC.3
MQAGERRANMVKTLQSMMLPPILPAHNTHVDPLASGSCKQPRRRPAYTVVDLDHYPIFKNFLAV